MCERLPQHNRLHNAELNKKARMGHPSMQELIRINKGVVKQIAQIDRKENIQGSSYADE